MASVDSSVIGAVELYKAWLNARDEADRLNDSLKLALRALPSTDAMNAYIRQTMAIDAIRNEDAPALGVAKLITARDDIGHAGETVIWERVADVQREWKSDADAPANI